MVQRAVDWIKSIYGVCVLGSGFQLSAHSCFQYVGVAWECLIDICFLPAWTYIVASIACELYQDHSFLK